MSEERTGLCLPHSPAILSVKSAESPFRLDPEGRRIFDTRQLPYQFSSQLWSLTNQEKGGVVDRSKFQIVPLKPKRDNLPGNLFPDSHDGRNHLAESLDGRFPDGEPNIRILNDNPLAEHVYILGSIENEADYVRVLATADHYKDTLNARIVTLIASYLAFSRQDKNMDSQGNYVPKTVNIRAAMHGFAGLVDRIIVFEPHSTATQYYAWDSARIPLAPISPWRYLMEEALSQPVDIGNGELILPNPQNTTIVGPDKGRNWAATRIADHFGYKYVSFDKIRLGDSSVEFREPTDEDKAKIAGHIAVAYDDEVATFGTTNGLASMLEKYGALAFVQVGVHAKCCGDWERNIDHSLIKRVNITDSREPVADLYSVYSHPKVSVTPLEKLTRTLIDADINGVNFWEDPGFSGMILQER